MLAGVLSRFIFAPIFLILVIKPLQRHNCRQLFPFGLMIPDIITRLHTLLPSHDFWKGKQLTCLSARCFEENVDKTPRFLFFFSNMLGYFSSSNGPGGRINGPPL